MIKIRKIKIHNYRKFDDFSFIVNNDINILVGDNDAGKSTILEALDLVLSGSLRKFENLGLNNIFNINATKEFLSLTQDERIFDNLPVMYIELYFEIDDKIIKLDYEGKNNSAKSNDCGIRLTCKPNEDYISEINNIIKCKGNSYFPYEYYNCFFDTFAGQQYSKKRNKLNSIWINTLNMNSRYAISEYIKKLYYNYTENETEMRLKFVNEINLQKSKFNNGTMALLNKKLPDNEDYRFGLQANTSIDFSQELTLINKNDNIDLFNHGTGEQIITNTKFSINSIESNVVLVEEPENHLSYMLLRYMISLIKQKSENQVFITTHNSMICTGLSLNKLIILSNKNILEPLKLENLDKETNEYFMKAPTVDILKVVLSSKVILLEGPSEFILFDKLYKKVTNHGYIEDKISILDIRGLSFKRYLDVINILKIKVAVITDNDRYTNDRINNLKKYEDNDNIRIFTEKDPDLNTFEVALYRKNQDVFKRNNISEKDMLKGKTDMALQILMSNLDIEVPDYINEAIQWIKN